MSIAEWEGAYYGEPCGWDGRGVFIGGGLLSAGFTRGKIYEVSGGKFVDDDGAIRPNGVILNSPYDDWLAAAGFLAVVE